MVVVQQLFHSRSAKKLSRDYENVYTDVQALERVGLIARACAVGSSGGGNKSGSVSALRKRPPEFVPV
ncbi:hypothetical protein GHYDROH2_17580 [Geobacter hydrogenophilus]|uniref:Uncharacterized protein n=1 Tax=Geobacter hydrogenophilus TaxID=40983 RepID=A0A9W6G0M5_9BACT|nr:hypothetical protein GHYDROH2_17580 [Geobacter hydrogenophilus]